MEYPTKFVLYSEKLGARRDRTTTLGRISGEDEVIDNFKDCLSSSQDFPGASVTSGRRHVTINAGNRLGEARVIDVQRNIQEIIVQCGGTT